LEVCGLNGVSEYLHWRLYEAMIVKKKKVSNHSHKCVNIVSKITVFLSLKQ